MSGGHFNYLQYKIQDAASDIYQIIDQNDSTDKDEFGYEIGYHFSADTIKKFASAAIILTKAAIMLQRVDWLISGDDGEESFHTRWEKDLKEFDDEVAPK